MGEPEIPIPSQDVDRNLVRDYVARAKAASRLDIGTDDPGIVLTKHDTVLNAGAALFVECDINGLRLATFYSDSKLDIIDTQWIKGPIQRLVKEAVDYVSAGTHRRPEFNGNPQRKDVPEIPLEALREAIINAFAHRIIESRQSVEVLIFKSYVDIISPGCFPDGLTPEMFFSNDLPTHRRNPKLTSLLYFSEDGECMATGLKRIKDTCDKAECRFVFLSSPYTFTVRFYRHCGKGWGPYENKAIPGKTPDDTLPASTDAAERLLSLIEANDRITRTEIAEELGVSVRTVQRLIKKTDGVHFEGTGAHGHWVITPES